jgi:hypothetical protein
LFTRHPQPRRSPRKPRAAKPATATAPHPDRPPAPEEIEAEVRRRPIGAVLVDICLDLGIVPRQMDDELKLVLIGHGGSLVRLLSGNWPSAEDVGPKTLRRPKP